MATKIELKKRIRFLEKELNKIFKHKSTNKIKERDNFECRSCGEKDNLEIHHLKPINIGGMNSNDNRFTFCKSCHLFMHCNPKLIMREKKIHRERTIAGIRKSSKRNVRGNDLKPRKSRGGVKSISVL